MPERQARHNLPESVCSIIINHLHGVRIILLTLTHFLTITVTEQEKKIHHSQKRTGCNTSENKVSMLSPMSLAITLVIQYLSQHRHHIQRPPMHIHHLQQTSLFYKTTTRGSIRKEARNNKVLISGGVNTWRGPDH